MFLTLQTVLRASVETYFPASRRAKVFKHRAKPRVETYFPDIVNSLITARKPAHPYIYTA